MTDDTVFSQAYGSSVYALGRNVPSCLFLIFYWIVCLFVQLLSLEMIHCELCILDTISSWDTWFANIFSKSQSVCSFS